MHQLAVSASMQTDKTQLRPSNRFVVVSTWQMCHIILYESTLFHSYFSLKSNLRYQTTRYQHLHGSPCAASNMCLVQAHASHSACTSKQYVTDVSHQIGMSQPWVRLVPRSHMPCQLLVCQTTSSQAHSVRQAAVKGFVQ